MAASLVVLKEMDFGKVNGLDDYRTDIVGGNFGKLVLDSDISALVVRYLTCFKCKNY